MVVSRCFHLMLLALPWALPATRRHGMQTQRAYPACGVGDMLVALIRTLREAPCASPDRIYASFSVCSGQVTQRVRMVMPPCGRPPAKAAVRTQKWDHMLSWISLASRSLL
jgi:hypothetical protein